MHIKKQPPIKNTGGEGFAVEDRVAAWLACHILSNTPWPNSQSGFVQAIRCQMRQDGWRFDDFVVEVSQNLEICRFACSVKSFPVFGRRGAPAEFRTAAWQEWLGTNSSPFHRGRDKLVLFAAPHDPEIREAWLSLLDMAKAEMSPETLAQRCLNNVDPSPLRQDVFRSMQCPADVDESMSRDCPETARLLRGFHLQEQDFDRADSQSVKQALLLCRQSLEDSASSQAPQLWRAMIVYAAEVRIKGGSVTLPSLLERLSAEFRLRHFPQYAEEWLQIMQDSQQHIASLPSKIGGELSIERRDLLSAIAAKHSETNITLLIGDSGFGKTVLAQNWATASPDSIAVWVRAFDLELPGGLSKRWNLRHDIATLFANVTKPARLVVDGLDKCFGEVPFNEAALLLKAALAEGARDRWLISLTCSPDEWERVQREFIRRGLFLNCHRFRVTGFTQNEVREVCDRIPSLKTLWNRHHLRSILSWPKALDIAATHWRSAASPQWASESDFARWFWSTAICRDQPVSMRDRVLRKLACTLADRLCAATKLEEFSGEETTCLIELMRECHVVIDRLSQTVRFAHDLIADWARTRELQVQGQQVATFLRARLQSPVWHRALRFYALDLLEHSNTAAEWRQLFEDMKSDDPVCQVAQNLLVEAPIFALKQRAVLEQLWPDFVAEDGKLLRRFLRQFLRAATLPDERYVAFFRNEPRMQITAAVRYRLPWVPYWFGVLRFLGDHQDDVGNYAREEVADVCLLWLPLYEATSKGMQAAANLALASARLLYRSGEHGHSDGHDISPEEKVCAALFAAAPILPDEVTELALKFSGRTLPDPEDGLPTEEPEFPQSRFAPRWGPRRPWPEGPQLPCNPDFRRAFMDLNWPTSLMKVLPNITEEIMFAALLSIPREGASPRDDWHHHDLDEHGFSTGDLRRESPFWPNGSFLTFLKAQPEIGLSAIIRLINFATDRCLELGKDIREPIEIQIRVNGQVKMWKGHRYSYLWHQGHVFGPRSVCCALLSLEKWLYLLMDEGVPLDKPIATLLNESRSLAIAAVLVCVGKRQPELFLGSLRPLLACADIYWIEESMKYRVEGDFKASMINEWSSSMREHVREWINMPHRKDGIGQFVLQKIFNDPKWRAEFEKIRTEWGERLAASTAENPVPEWLPRIVAQYDLKNWKAERVPEGLRISYIPPDNLPQPTPEEMAEFEFYQKLTLVPFQCSRILKGEISCTEDEMEVLWNDLSAVRNLKVPEGSKGLRNVEDATCGIIAVAVVRHRTWLAANSDREREAAEILMEVGENPPPPFWLVENDVCDFKWDIFAAWALATLWTEFPDDPFLRQAVGSFAVWEREMVVDRVLRVAAQKRVELGKNFEQLFAHAIRYAPAKHRMFMEKHWQKKSFDIGGWIEEHLGKFQNGQTQLLPESWGELAQPQWWRGAQTSGFDVGHMNAALGWAEDLGLAFNVAERKQWIGFYHQALICAASRIFNLRNRDPAAPKDSHDRQEKFAFKDEEGLLERASSVLARLKSGDPHHLLWKPIFELGADGCHWIRSFVSHWLIEANRTEEVAPCFVEQWLAMLEFADNSPFWRGQAGNPWDLRDTWQHLLGLSPFGSEFWRIELKGAVRAAWPFFKKWAARNVGFYHDARTFIHFLKAPAVEEMRLEGLCLLREHVEMDEDRFWEEHSTQEAFAEFLRTLLDKDWQKISQSTIYRDAFMSFALKLTALQHPLGSEVTTIAANRLAGAAPATSN